MRGELFFQIARLRSCEIAREIHQLKIIIVSVAERPNAAIGGTVGGAACRVSSVRVRPETPFLNPQHEIARRAGQDAPGLAAA